MTRPVCSRLQRCRCSPGPFKPVMVLNRGLRFKSPGRSCSGRLFCSCRDSLTPSAPLVWCLLWEARPLPGSLLVPQFISVGFFLTEDPFHITGGLAGNLQSLSTKEGPGWCRGPQKAAPGPMEAAAPSPFVCLETPLLRRPSHSKYF